MDNVDSTQPGDTNRDGGASTEIDTRANRGARQSEVARETSVSALASQLVAALIPTRSMELTAPVLTTDERLARVESLMSDVLWTLGFIAGFLLFLLFLRR